MANLENKDQLQKTFEVFKEQPLTMLQASRILNIERANICRYVSKLRKHHKIAVVKKIACPITRHPAGQLTTNPDLFPKPQQLELFSNE